MVSIERLYDYVIDKGHEFNLNNLLDLGFTSEDIESLKYKGIISGREGLYRFEDADALFEKGRRLMINKQYDDGVLYLRRVLEIDPKNNEAWSKWLTQAIKEEKFDDVFSLLDRIPETEKNFHKHDYYYLLFLLNFITELPEKYNSFVKYLGFQDIEVPVDEARYEDRVWQNRVRNLAMFKKFKKAYNEQQDLIKESGYPSEQEYTFRELIRQICVEEKRFHNITNLLISHKNYSGALDFLLKRKDKCGLSVYDYHVLKLLETIEELDALRVIPHPGDRKCNTVFEAIYLKDYKQALELCAKDGRNSNNNAIHVLLKTICGLIDEIGEDNLEFLRENKKPEVETVENPSTVEEIVARAHTLLQGEKDIVFLDHMIPSVRREVHLLVAQYGDIADLSYGKGEERRILIRRKPIITEGYDVKKTIDLAKRQFARRDYDDSIKTYVNALDHINWPRSGIFASIAFAYFKKGEAAKALDYFIVANALAKEQKLSFNYDGIIADIKAFSLAGEKNITVDVDEKDFNSDDNHGIDNFDSINDYIILSGCSVLEGCQKFGLTEEETDTVKLLFAREYFSQGMPDMGESFLRAFEKSENKTPDNIKLLQEIRKNKGLYAKKNNGEAKKLSLTIKP